MSYRVKAEPGTAFGAPCAQCASTLIAPVWSEHVDERCVRHLWACDECEYEFETLVYFPLVQGVLPAAGPSPTLAPEAPRMRHASHA